MVHRSRRLHGTCAVAALFALLLPPAAQAAEAPPAALVDDALVAEARRFLENDIVVLSVDNQNRLHRDFTPADIDRLDTQWRQERETSEKPLIAATLANPLSNYLTRIQAHSVGLFTEIFVTDRHGLNVGQSNITSDYWQGDEAKFERTYPRGADAVFVDEPEYHEASGTWRVQLNLSVADADRTLAIGAATFEINLTELARRRAVQP